MNVALFMGTDTKLTLYNQGCFFTKKGLFFSLPKELIFGSNLFLKGLIFQSYLSPGLTLVHSPQLLCLYSFQSYLSPGLTIFPLLKGHDDKQIFNPTLVRV